MKNIKPYHILLIMAWVIPGIGLNVSIVVDNSDGMFFSGVLMMFMIFPTTIFCIANDSINS